MVMRICLKSSLLPLPNQDVCRSLRIFIGPFDATPHPIGSLGSGAHNAVLVPLQRMRLDRQGRPRNLRYRNPMGPGIGRYGNVAGIASRTALGLCKPDHDECPRRGNLIEVGNPLRLGKMIVHQPVFPLQVRCGIRVQGLMAMEEYLSLQMEKLQRGETERRERVFD